MFLHSAAVIAVLSLLAMKTVLVTLGDNTRVVSFNNLSSMIQSYGAVLTEAVKATFKDVLLPGRSFFLQLKSEEWGGVFLDLLPNDDIPDKSVIRAVLQPTTEVYILLCRYGIENIFKVPSNGKYK